MIDWLTKKRLFAFHGWLGLTFGLPLFIICLSGTFAVMAPELDRLIHPEMRVLAPAGTAARPLSWQTLVERAEQACPGGEVAFLDASADRDSAWQATVAYSARDQRLVFIDPFTGSVRGQATAFNARSFFRIFHKQLYILEGPAWPHGRVIVCACSIVLLLSALTGLMFFRGWWKALFRLRLRAGKRAFWSDLHRFSGVWSFLLAVLFAVTGFWYLLVRLMEDFGIAEHDPMPEIPAEVSAARPPALQRLTLDELADRARARFPEFTIRAVATGIQPSSAVRFYGEGPAILAGEMTNQIHLDPYSGEILMTAKAHELSAGKRLAAASYPLHFGRFGGYVTKIIWTIAGLSISAGIFAGSVIWWLRARREDPVFFRRNRKWSIASLSLNIVIIGLATVSTFSFIRAQINGSDDTTTRCSLGKSAIGPWLVEAYQHHPASQGAVATSFRFDSGEDANYRAAFAWIGSDERPAGLRSLQGTRRWLPGPARSSPGDLHLEIEGWDGSVHAANFVFLEQGPAAGLIPSPPPSVPIAVWLVVGSFVILLVVPTGIWLVRIR